MRRYSFFIALLLLLTAGSCKKETTATNSIYGTYQRLKSNSFQPIPEYYSFNEAQKKVFKFTADEYGIRDIEEGALRITGSTVQFDLGKLQLGDYRFSGDTLFLTYASVLDELVLLKQKSAPALPEQWMTPVEPTNFFADSLRANSMTYYNGRLYITVDQRSTIKVYNVATRSLESTLTLSDIYGVIEFAGGNLWSGVKYDNQLLRINPTTGATLFTSTASSWGSPDALAFDGVNLQSVSNSVNLKYKIATDVFSHSDGPTADIRDMAYYDGRYYAVVGGTIHRLNGSLQEEKSWRVNNFDVDAIAFDGTKFWVHGVKSGEYLSSFAQIELN
ncbi:MAG: hypothetical protein U0T84_07910 [Chitinophagales bacterium]